MSDNLLRRIMYIALGLAIGTFIGLAVYAQGPVAVTLVDGKVPNVVTPNALAIVTGQDWSPFDFRMMTGATELGGYRVTLDGQSCLVTQVSSVGIVFIVPETVREGLDRVLVVTGPISLSQGVRIDPFAPMIMKQTPPGEEDADCCVIAVGFANLAPRLYLGEPIPVGFVSYNYVQIVVRGLATGQQNGVSRPLVTLQRNSEVYQAPGDAYAFPGFPGAERLGFSAFPCLKGEYRIKVERGGFASNWGIIRFTSDCSSDVQIKRGGLVR